MIICVMAVQYFLRARMSATIHEPDSLTGIFKMDAPKVVEAESRFP